jgi:lipopolysaccharide export system permease protein
LINKGIGFAPLLKTFTLLLPSFFVLTLPMACLIASISAFSRLSSDRELTALQATGVSLGRLLRPVWLFSLGVFAVTVFLAQFAQPWTGQSVKKSALVLLRNQVSLALDEGVFNTPTDNVVMFIGERSLPGGPRGIFISDTRPRSEPRIYVASDWRIINDPLHNRVGMTLQNGTIHVNPKDPRQYRMIKFTTYDFKLDLSESLAQAEEGRPSIFEIRYRLFQSQGQNPQYLRLLEDEYRNVAFPTATLLFGLVGVPLGIVAKRSGRAGGFAVGILIILCYYVLNVVGDFSVSKLLMPPFAAAWFPNVVLGLVAVLLFRRRSQC